MAVLEIGAVTSGSAPLALAAVVWVGLGVAILTWIRPSAAILALLVLLPLVTIEVGLGDVQRTVSTDKAALAAVAGAWLLTRAVHARGLLRSPLVRWWLAFLAVVAASSVVNGPTLREAWGAVEHAVLAVVFFAALHELTRLEARWVPVIAALTAGVVSVLGVVEWAAGRLGMPLVFYFKHGVMFEGLPGSTIAHTNYLGGYLVLLLPTLVVLTLVERAPLRPLAAVATAAGLGALLYAYSVGAWAGGIAAAVVLVGRGVRRWPVRARLAGLAVVILLVLVALVVEAVKVRAGSVSFAVRAATYRIGLAAIAERPLLGHGSDGYTRESPRIERQLYGRVLTEIHPEGEALSAHSSYVDVAVERGLLGLAAFLGLLGAVLILGLRGASGGDGVGAGLLVAGLVAGLVGFGVQALTENLFGYSKVAAVLWILVAAMVRLAADGAAPLDIVLPRWRRQPT